MSQVMYWDERYGHSDGATHHALQNFQISRDFIKAVIREKKDINQALASRSIIEIGCGNGALADLVSRLYKPEVYLATDLAPLAIADAQRRYPALHFERFDILNDWPTLMGGFQLAVASNVLEHFKNPWLVLDRMLVLAEQALVLVPYRQAVTDGYDNEGGPGHVFCFRKVSFRDYNVIETLSFESEGWRHQSKKEKPLQLAVLVGRKPDVQAR